MTIHLDIVTPEKLAISAEVDYIAAPAADGEIGILPGHAPLLARLGLGPLRYRIGNETKVFVVAGGFLEVQKGSKVSVFAEAAEMADEIDLERAKQAAERAKAKLSTAHDLTAKELAEVELALSRAITRVKVATGWRKLPPPRAN
jgi:F-type H+-transporting ATPase subunit epsilon